MDRIFDRLVHTIDAGLQPLPAWRQFVQDYKGSDTVKTTGEAMDLARATLTHAGISLDRFPHPPSDEPNDNYQLLSQLSTTPPHTRMLEVRAWYEKLYELTNHGQLVRVTLPPPRDALFNVECEKDDGDALVLPDDYLERLHSAHTAIIVRFAAACADLAKQVYERLKQIRPSTAVVASMQKTAKILESPWAYATTVHYVAVAVEFLAGTISGRAKRREKERTEEQQRKRRKITDAATT